MSFIEWKSKEDKFALKYARLTLITGILLSILIFLLICLKIISNNGGFHSYYRLLLILSIFSFLFFIYAYIKFNDELKINLSIILSTCTFMIFGIEIYFQVSIPRYPYGIHKLRKEKSARLNIFYDDRTKFEVLKDLRNTGHQVYPTITPFGLLLNENSKQLFITKKNEMIFPLSTISSVRTIFPNELGYYPIILTDEHGFNNPKGLYIKNEVDIILIGDSFVEGCSVDSDKTIGSVLREEGYNTISLGKFGNEPLINFATLREYGYPYKPKIVLWFYYVNDLPALEEYKSWTKSTILANYLDDDYFTQSLISRQKQIDSLLIIYANEKWNSKIKKNKILGESESNALQRIAKLYNFRKKLLDVTISKNKSQSLKPEKISKETLTIFRNILKKADKLVSDWDGEMYFIYLPSYKNIIKDENDKYHQLINQIISQLQIPTIDIKKEVFDKTIEPLSLFPFELPGHYNAQGYKIIGETIADIIKNRFKRTHSKQ